MASENKARERLGPLGATGKSGVTLYEELRNRLILFFRQRFRLRPEDDADEVLERLILKLAAGAEVASPAGYAYGIAKIYLLEQSREPGFVDIDQVAIGSAGAVEPVSDSGLRACLEKLPADDRKLIVTYYGDDDAGKARARSNLAREFGCSENSLRVRVFRIRERLKQCLQKGCNKSRQAST